MEETSHPGNHIRHETTDINVWAVGRFAIALVVVTIISLALVFGLMLFFQSREQTRLATTVQPTKLFPQPQLQQTPVLDLRAVRAEEDHVLNSYGWVDQPKGIVRIPVAQAIDILAKRGLPHTAPAPAKEAPKQ
jgi:hypothetical protein